MSSSELTPRLPGAQPGNTNAFKHGLYSPRLRLSASGNPQKVKYTGISDEIELLRESIRHVAELNEDIHSLPEALSYLRVLALASMSLSRLVRAQKLITDSNNKMTIGRPVSEGGAVSEDASPTQESEEFDPTIQWARCDPPEGFLEQYLPKFNPADYGEKSEDDEEDEED